jgi:hypothetical protein
MLTHLNLSSCRLLTDAGVAQLASMPLARALRTLSLSNCRGLTDVGLSYVQHMRSLQHLCLYGLKHVSGQGIACLQTLPLLTLDLRLCKGVSAPPPPPPPSLLSAFTPLITLTGLPSRLLSSQCGA